MTFEGGRNMCKAGGSLAIIRTQAQNEALMQLLKDESINGIHPQRAPAAR